jgi:hypothetical protein
MQKKKASTFHNRSVSKIITSIARGEKFFTPFFLVPRFDSMQWEPRNGSETPDRKKSPVHQSIPSCSQSARTKASVHPSIHPSVSSSVFSLPFFRFGLPQSYTVPSPWSIRDLPGAMHGSFCQSRAMHWSSFSMFHDFPSLSSLFAYSTLSRSRHAHRERKLLIPLHRNLEILIALEAVVLSILLVPVFDIELDFCLVFEFQFPSVDNLLV